MWKEFENLNRDWRTRFALVAACWSVACMLPGALHADDSLTWYQNYKQACDAAKAESRLLMICFNSPERSNVTDVVEASFAENDGLKEAAAQFVFLQQTTDSEITSKGETRPLLQFGAFREMRDSPGIAIIDYRNDQSTYFGRVVTVYPLTASRRIETRTLTAISKLPEASMTQRALVLAVMLHPQQPQSVDGEWHDVLADETESHSLHQASITNQGHHNWNSRFHRINGRIGLGMRAQEVCAESWPGESLVDAAEECVNSWRQSSGHWGAVSGRQRLFAYDMKRGSNGVWYATGIFCR